MSYHFVDEYSKLSVEEIKKEIENGFDVNSINNYGECIAHLMVKDLQLLKLFQEKGGDFSKITKNLQTILHFACDNFAPLENVKFLVENGVNLDLEDNCGKPAIFYAKFRGSDYLVNYLLDCGAKDVEITEDESNEEDNWY